MAYKTKFLHFKTKESYKAERAKTTEGSEERKVFDAYISFIDEGPTICTWGEEYQCDANSLSLLPQEVTTEKQNQALDNIGLNFMVIDVTEGKAVLTAEQETQLLSSRGVILKGDGLGAFGSKLFIPYNVESQIVYFYTIFSRYDLVYIIYTKATKTIEYKGSVGISDRVALHKKPESLSVEQQEQVFKNLGWKVHVISQSDINATTSPDAAEKTKRLEATALLVKETSLIYVRGNDDSSNHYFFKINSSSQLELFRISITTGIIYRINSQFVDTGVIRYDRTQTLSDSNKTLARENIDAANKNDVLPLTIDLSSQTVEDYNTALEAFNSKKPLTTFDSTDPTFRFTANLIEKEATTNDINVYFSFTGTNDDNTFNSIGYVWTIKPTGEKTLSFATIMPSNTDPKPLGPLASSGADDAYSRSDHVHPIQESVAKLTTPRTIALTGAVSGSTTFDGSSNVSINSTLANIDASKITSGTLNADRLPEIPAATSSAYGGIQIGYTTSNKNYAVQLSNGKAYVNVPWTDTNTNYYPTTFTWTNGTTAGPTGSLTGSGMSTVSFGAIPSASATQSGVVTTGDQSFAGEKIFRGGISAQDADISDLIIGSSLEFNAFGRFNYIATSTEAGGIKIGATASGANLPLVLNSSNQAYIAVTKGAITAALGFTPANVSNIPIPIALPNPYALTINGISYTGSSAVSISASKPLSARVLTSSTVTAGYSYSCNTSKAISTLNGFSSTNPDSVIISSAKLTFPASDVIKMDGLDDLSGTWYIYCLSYMANSKIAVNGAVYA